MIGWLFGMSAILCLLAVLLVRTRWQLAASRAAFVAISEHAPIGILQADAAGQCVEANEIWCDLSGLSLQQTLGHRWSQAVHPDDLQAVMDQWQDSVASGQPYLNEVRLLRPDGTVCHVLATARAIQDVNGRISGFLGTVLDLTSRRTAERQAREKESLLKALVDHSSAAIYLKDSKGRYLMANRRHLEILPAMREFCPGSTPCDRFPTALAQSFVETDAEVFRTGQTLTYREVLPQGEEQHTYLSVKFPVLDEGGGVIAVGGISADISELEQAQRDLEKRERLLRTLIEVQENEKQLLCHEFHDGLIQYAVGSKMLLEALRERELDPPCREVVRSVIDCLAKGIEDGRRVILGIRPAALDDLGLRAALDDLAYDLRGAGISVEAVLDPAIDLIAPQLQTTLYRVAQESLNNVRKHSGSATVRLTVVREASNIMLTTEDAGQGFQQAAAGPEGFGLLGMRERVRLLGGVCVVESAPGQGTRVRVSLPVQTDDAIINA